MFTRLASPRLLHTQSLSRRARSTFQLDKQIFTPALYKNVTDIWLPDIKLDGSALDPSSIKRWFASTPDERLAFDKICRENFGLALESIGPEKYPSPSSAPFLRELADIERNGQEGEAAWTALSMVLLLDQMPRNIFRTNEGLKKVYTHYDTLSYSLVQALLAPSSPIPRPDLHPQWRLSTVHRMWFYLPLMHAEDFDAHNTVDSILAELNTELEKVEGYNGSKGALQGHVSEERKHRDILDRFGRYPHRNAALGRTTTDEERAFLEEGGATFGVVQEKETGNT